MALQYGLNLPSSNIKQILERNDKQQSGIRTWSQLFGGASLGFGAQSDTLTTDYTSAMAQAYKSNFEQNAAIMSSGLSSGGTQQLLSMSRQELLNTYDTYVSNYAKDLSGAVESYSGEVGMLDEALTERAENFSNALNHMKQYREQLADYSFTGDEETHNYFKEKGLDWMLDEEGELLSEKKLNDILVNTDGSLTDRGIEFFDAMLNASPQGYKNAVGEDAKSFDEWLSDADPELREWLMSKDEFNYNFAGTNLGTANILTGRESIDQSVERPDYNILTGVEKFRKTIQDKVYETLENKGREGITTISDIDSRQKKAEGKLRSYGEWFDYAQKVIDKQFAGNVWGKDENAAVVAMNSYIEDYKKYSKTEFETFSSELKNLFGEKISQEFWNEYGKEIQDLYLSVQNFDDKDIIKRYQGTGPLRGVTGVKNALNTAKELKNLGFDKAMRKLYKDLETFLGKQRSRAVSEIRNTSGF